MSTPRRRRFENEKELVPLAHTDFFTLHPSLGLDAGSTESEGSFRPDISRVFHPPLTPTSPVGMTRSNQSFSFNKNGSTRTGDGYGVSVTK